MKMGVSKSCLMNATYIRTFDRLEHQSYSAKLVSGPQPKTKLNQMGSFGFGANGVWGANKVCPKSTILQIANIISCKHKVSKIK